MEFALLVFLLMWASHSRVSLGLRQTPRYGVDDVDCYNTGGMLRGGGGGVPTFEMGKGVPLAWSKPDPVAIRLVPSWLKRNTPNSH